MILHWSWQLAQDELIFTSLIDVFQLIPVANFQFRGEVSLVGSGKGVSYVSSDPDSIYVTPQGYVYVLKEVNAGASITVSYEGLDDIVIPVITDFSKNITGIKLASGNNWELPSLNRYHDLPSVKVVFDDESESDLNLTLKPVLSIPESAQSILKTGIDNDNLRSNSAILTDQAVPITVSLNLFPEFSTIVNVSAIDALPQIKLIASNTAVVGADYKATASVSDDVGISSVSFMIDGTTVGHVDEAPYTLQLPVHDSMAGQTFTLQATVTDLSGQQQISELKTVTARQASSGLFPSMTFAAPFEGERIIEGAPYYVQLYRSLEPEDSLIAFGEIGELSKIEYFEIFQDGRKVGHIDYAVIIEDKSTEKDDYYEVWQTSIDAPEISVDETSTSLTAVAYINNNSYEYESRLIRLKANESPLASITKPVGDKAVTAGDTIAVSVLASDDSLNKGTKYKLFVDDQLVEETSFYNAPTNTIFDEKEKVTGKQSQTKHFSISTDESQIGKTLSIKAQVEDYHGLISQSDIVEVAIQSDQNPDRIVISSSRRSTHCFWAGNRNPSKCQ